MDLQVSDLCKRYGNESILNRISFDALQGEFISIIGPNGCGKSTLLRLLSGIEDPTSGDIRFKGERRSHGPLATIVWQEFALLPWRSALHNVSLGLEFQGVPSRTAKEIADRWLERVSAQEFAAKMPNQLSAGYKQRVAIARALAADPEVLLMDEPFASIDAQTRPELHKKTLRLWETTEKTVLLVTHSVIEACVLADRVIILTDRPAHVQDIVDIQTPRPERDYLVNHAFGREVAAVRAALDVRGHDP